MAVAWTAFPILLSAFIFTAALLHFYLSGDEAFALQILPEPHNNDILASLSHTLKQVAKPALIGITVALLVNVEAVRRKARLLLYGFIVMIFTSDMRWNKKSIPDPDQLKDQKCAKKRVIFIRHGESKWNEAFNKSKMPHKFIPAVLKAFFGELLLLPEFDSVLFDSPLNVEGFTQAKVLARALDTHGTQPASYDQTYEMDMAALRGEPSSPSAVVVSSNLRRATQTAVVALRGRLGGQFGFTEGREKEQVKILSCLQEISRNVDTISLAEPHSNVSLPDVLENLPDDVGLNLGTLFDVSENRGNKPVLGTGLQRLFRFCNWSHACDEDVIIVAGHSLWFRHFFRTFLPASTDVELARQARDYKMMNGGAVGFDLQKGEAGGKVMFRIDPESITVVHEGFDIKKKKKKKSKKD